jgi:hypothetical protein
MTPPATVVHTAAVDTIGGMLEMEFEPALVTAQTR